VIVVGAIVLPSIRICGCVSDAAVAIGSLRAINSAQRAYAAACGNGGFAVDLADLAAPPSAGATGFVSPDLDHNGVIKQGYSVALTAGAGVEQSAKLAPEAACSGATHAPTVSYFAIASPIGEPAGRLHYATDARGVIYQSSKPIANPITPGPDVLELR